MLLQVHDELIFEAPKIVVDAVIALVTEIMQGARRRHWNYRCRCGGCVIGGFLGGGALNPPPHMLNIKCLALHAKLL